MLSISRALIQHFRTPLPFPSTYAVPKYTLTKLVVLCESFLITVVDASDNAASLYAFAELFSLADLKSAILTYVLRSEELYREFQLSEGFAEMDPVSEVLECKPPAQHLLVKHDLLFTFFTH